MTLEKLKTAVANINAFLSESHDDDETVSFSLRAIKAIKENYEELINYKEDEINLKKSNWISVKDRVPNRHETVLCYHKFEPDSPNVICENTYLGSGLWMYDGSKVTHWMPLPEFPKQGEEKPEWQTSMMQHFTTVE